MGWQMAAIKYEKDRAANSLLPNYNTYGRYDIPSYYESYWQTPEERYYTGELRIAVFSRYRKHQIVH
uniref:TonB-dependent receptor n=1 Tax=Heterorhabditis bacteriophora TaxID=37862 RepID=A0A1I7X1V6_HETBA